MKKDWTLLSSCSDDGAASFCTSFSVAAVAVYKRDDEVLEVQNFEGVFVFIVLRQLPRLKHVDEIYHTMLYA